MDNKIKVELADGGTQLLVLINYDRINIDKLDAFTAMDAYGVSYDDRNTYDKLRAVSAKYKPILEAKSKEMSELLNNMLNSWAISIKEEMDAAYRSALGRSNIHEAYKDVGIEWVKTNRPKLGEYGAHTTRMVVGEFTYVQLDNPPLQKAYGITEILVFDNTDGTEVAKCGYQPADEYGYPTRIIGSIDVRMDVRRKGIATNIYKWIEELTGKTMVADPKNSDLAKAFWSQPNRPFGNIK